MISKVAMSITRHAIFVRFHGNEVTKSRTQALQPKWDASSAIVYNVRSTRWMGQPRNYTGATLGPHAESGSYINDVAPRGGARHEVVDWAASDVHLPT